MRSLLLATAAFGIFTFSPDTAEAKRAGGGGYYEDLVFLSEIPDSGGEGHSLCLLTRTSTVLFLNYWRTAEKYVIASNRCEAEQYGELSAVVFAQGQAEGVFPPSLPATPRLDLPQVIGGFWGLLPIVGLLGLGLLAKLAKRRPTKPTDRGAVARRVIQVLVHAAKADGVLTQEEIDVIGEISQQLTGTALPESEIRRLFDESDGTLTPETFRSFAQGLNDADRRLVMQAALVLLGADGDVPMAEQQFIGGLAGGLGIKGEEVRAMFARMAAPGTAQPA
ncbi:TerB family tellurite resistance protein [Thalassococcus sp. BH17M4-6]|uniref:tellurite resistance TerB family protein n=1 Tax=Thalassococcus sp. BH17M4-6 TaxID=3413148 RepID=UPI003BE317C7